MASRAVKAKIFSIDLLMTDAPYDPFNAGTAPPKGQRKVSAVISTPEQKARIAAQRHRAPWPAPGKPLNGVAPGAWREQGETDETGELPEDCPVRPLGYDGEQFFFVDTSGQIFNTGTASMGVERVQKLFAGNEDFLCWAWPAYSRDGKRVTGFKAEEVRRDLYAACRVRGPFSMTDMVRGRGAWLLADGRLLLHCGEYLWLDGKLQDTGEVGEHFYVRRPSALLPWGKPVDDDLNPAPEIFRLLRSWRMARGDTDAMLVLGHIGVSLLGAALGWRPSLFIVGDAGTGKSTLVGKGGLLRAILGRSMIATTNATEAGLYSIVGHDSLPIAIDEMEGDEGQEQARKIIKMARDAASGSVRIRGSSDHKGVEFQAQSTFLFSGINPPGIPQASMTRLAVIQLMPLPADGKEPRLAEPETVGPRLLRLLADRFKDFPKHFEDYRTVLRGHNHDSRGQNTFGTFLALAHLMLGDAGMSGLGLPFEDLEPWGAALAADIAPELADNLPPWQDFLDKLFASTIDAMIDHGQRYTIGQVVDELRKGDWEWNRAERYLAAAGLGLIDRRAEKLGSWLAIPNRSKAIGKAMADTAFEARDGNGTWSWALRRCPHDFMATELPAGAGGRAKAGNRVSIAGSQQRCVFLHLASWRKWQDNL